MKKMSEETSLLNKGVSEQDGCFEAPRVTNTKQDQPAFSPPSNEVIIQQISLDECIIFDLLFKSISL